MQGIINFILSHQRIFIIVGGVLLFSLLFLSFTFFLNKKDLKDEANILSNLTRPRIFILNFNDGTVTYFDRGQHKHQKNGPINQFYHQFMTKEVEGLETWTNSLLVQKSGAELYYKVDVFVKSMRRSYPSLLEVTRIDYEKKIVHLESYLYRYLRAKDQMNVSIKKREHIGYLNEAGLNKLFRRAQARGLGVYGAINIDYITSGQSQKVVPPHIIFELQNQVALYRRKKQIVLEVDKNTVGLYFARADENSVILSYLERITKRMRAFLEINGYDEYSLAIGVARAKEFKSQQMCFKTAEELSHFAHRDESKVYIYDPREEIKDLDLSLFRNEVMQIISRKSVDTYFQPIVNAKNAEIVGYLASYGTSGMFFANYKELAHFARENKLSEPLTKMTLKKSAANYFTMRRSNKHLLFIPLVIEATTFLKDIFLNQPHMNELKYSFVVDEDELKEHFDQTEAMRDVLLKIKELGHEVTLVITDTELTLPDTIYALADCFMVNEKIISYTQNDEREKLYLLSSLGKLLRHQKPIMITDLSKWSEIEYYIRAGIDYVASDEISKSETHLQVLDKKKTMRITNFSKRRREKEFR